MPSQFDLEALEIFCRQLSSLVKSGHPLASGLREIAAGLRSAALRNAIEDLAMECAKGTRLSDAMATRPSAFPEVYVSIVRAGEKAGNLDSVLGQLADHASRSARVGCALRAALLYPKIIFIVVIAVLSLVYMFVVPSFGRVFEDLSIRGGLPVATQVALELSASLRTHWWLPVALVGLVLFGGRLLSSVVRLSPALRRVWDRLAFAFPVTGDVRWLGEMGRVCGILGIASETGLPLHKALRLTAGTLENAYVAAELERVADSVERGESLDRALRHFGSAPRLLTWAISFSQGRGSLPTELRHFSDQYQERAEAAVPRIGEMMEVIITPLLGTVVGATVISIFLPLVKILQEMGD